MTTVILIIHLMIAIAMVGLILLQRSEGGALGIGGGGAGGFMTARGTANVLTRTTTILAIAFFSTSILLTLLADTRQPAADSVIDSPEALPMIDRPAPREEPGIPIPPGDD